MRSPIRPLIAGIAGAATLVALAACAPPAEEPERPTTLRVATDLLLINNWDPIQGANGDLFSFQSVFDGLTYWDPATETYSPRLAREITLSEDRMTVTFELRDDVVFSDGEKMNAAGVEKFYDALLSSGKYVFTGTIAGYDVEFTATDEYTLEMSLAKPFYVWDFWILLTAYTPVLSPTAVDDPERAMAEPLGSGPYLLDEVVPDVQATFVRNPDYWDPESYPFDTIVVQIMADPTARLNALKSGQLDAAPLTLAQVAEAESSGLGVHQGTGFYYSLYSFDPDDSTDPAFGDPRVSQAISMAFDRDLIAETVDFGYGISSNQGFIPSQASYVEGEEDRYAYDPEGARELLAEAGYPDGLDVTIPTYAGLSHLEPIILDSLAEIGVRVTWETFPDALAWTQAYMAGTYPFVLNQVFNINNLRFFTEDFPGFGRLRGEITEVTELIETIKWGTPEDSAEAADELGEKALDEALWIPISRPPAFWGSQTEFTVRVSEVTGSVDLIDIQLAE